MALQGFRSFRAFKADSGPAGAGMQWHHLVEQTAGNVARFGAENIHIATNLFRVSTPVHRQISAFYSSIQPQVTGSTAQTVRQWLSTQSFQDQSRFGRDIMQMFGAP